MLPAPPEDAVAAEVPSAADVVFPASVLSPEADEAAPDEEDDDPHPATDAAVSVRARNKQYALFFIIFLPRKGTWMKMKAAVICQNGSDDRQPGARFQHS